MKLFARWNSKDSEKATEAVMKINDQKKLARIAVGARLWTARKLAVEKLIAADHQPLLSRIAKTDEDWNVRLAAIAKLRPAEHQPLLAEIAEKDSDDSVRIAAIERLNAADNIQLLARIASTTTNQELCRAAMHQLISVEREILYHDVHCMSAPEPEPYAPNVMPYLIELAKTDMDYSHLRAIIAMIVDEASLLDVAVNAANLEARQDALDRLTDRDLLWKAVVGIGHAMAASEDEAEKRANEMLLHLLYRKHDDADLLAKIASYNGLIIEEHRPAQGFWDSDGAVSKSAFVEMVPERPARRFRVP
jgi:hypothetical protein